MCFKGEQAGAGNLGTPAEDTESCAAQQRHLRRQDCNALQSGGQGRVRGLVDCSFSDVTGSSACLA